MHIGWCVHMGGMCLDSGGVAACQLAYSRAGRSCRSEGAGAAKGAGLLTWPRKQLALNKISK